MKRKCFMQNGLTIYHIADRRQTRQHGVAAAKSVQNTQSAASRAFSPARIQKLCNSPKLLANDQCVYRLPRHRSTHYLVVLLTQSESGDRRSDAGQCFSRSTPCKGGCGCWQMQVEGERCACRPQRPCIRQRMPGLITAKPMSRLFFFQWHPFEGQEQCSSFCNEPGRRGGLFPR